MEADRKIGWTFKRPYPVSEPVLWWRLLGTSVESSCHISVSRFSSGWRLHLGHALSPATYSGDSTGDRETDSKYLWFIIFNYLFISFALLLHSLHLCTHYVLQSRINPTIIFALLPMFYSNLVVEYSIIVTPVRTYPRRMDPWVGRNNGGI